MAGNKTRRKYINRVNKNQVLGRVTKDWNGDWELNAEVKLPDAAITPTPNGRQMKELYHSELIKAVTEIIKADNPERDDRDIAIRAKQATSVFIRAKWELPAVAIIQPLSRWMQKIGWQKMGNGIYRKLRV